MFEIGKSRKAFENCPNRSITSQSSGASNEFICPKIPQGISVDQTDLHTKFGRNKMAMRLGCLACPYGKEEFARKDTMRLMPDGAMETTTEYLPKQADQSTNQVDPNII